MSKTKFSLNSTFVKATDRMQLIKCIRWVIYENLPLADCVKLADRLIAGESIELDICGYHAEIGLDGYSSHRTAYPSFMDAVMHNEPDPYAEARKRQAEISRLLELGASGDAEAAIAYCKHMLSGHAYGSAVA